MSTDLVIAGGFREAAEFRAQESLPSRSAVRSREGLTGRRPARVHILPEFFRKRDLPAWRSQLKKLLLHSPKTQILVWAYGDSGFIHTHDVRLDTLSRFVQLEADSTRPEPRPRVVKVDPVPDTEVPGQIAVEEAIEAAEADKPEGQPAAPEKQSAPESQAEKPDKPKGRPKAAKKPKPTKEEVLADLEAKGVIEPEGFELSDDPAVQAKQILESAASQPAGDDDPFGTF